MNIKDDKKGAAVKFPPPLIFLFWIIAGYGVQQVWPMEIENNSFSHLVGWSLVIVGIITILTIRRAFTRAGTSIEPWDSTSKIITTGFYAYSRNPIYISFCIVSLGIGVLLNSVWVIISFMPSLSIIYFMAIKKEEAYLEAKFGAEYIEYKNKVRRWL
ncbi:MAG: methyltransferase family protein [Fidelibacterota bacterium]